MTSASEKSKLRVAVIGCGAIGALHATGITGSPDAELVGVLDTDANRADALARKCSTVSARSLDELFDRTAPNAVTIATPDDAHREPSLAAIERGLHVFCEKPLAMTSPEAAEIVEASDRHGVKLAVDYNRRFGFGYQTAKRLIDEGRVGQVRNVTIQVSDRVPPPAVIRSPDVMLTTLLIHHFDLVEHLGAPVVEVLARSSSPVATPKSGDNDLLREITVASLLENGALATIVGSYRDRLSRTSEWTSIGGETGSVSVRDVTREVRLTLDDVDETTLLTPNLFAEGDAFEATIVAHVQDFVARLRDRREVSVSGRVAWQGTLIVEAARESLALGRSVEVPRIKPIGR
ncbi:MAG: Gfo/Idh/MocA family oxidoreductase [Planctomycetota bacterium]